MSRLHVGRDRLRIENIIKQTILDGSVDKYEYIMNLIEHVRTTMPIGVISEITPFLLELIDLQPKSTPFNKALHIPSVSIPPI